MPLTEAGAESSDSTLAEGRAALDDATRKTLYCVSSGDTRCWLPPREGKFLQAEQFTHNLGLDLNEKKEYIKRELKTVWDRINK